MSRTCLPIRLGTWIWTGNRSTTLCLLRETKLEITDVGEMNMNPTSIHVHKSIDPAGLQLKLKLKLITIMIES